MNRQLHFIKNTVVGGFIFLIPVAIAVLALGKVIGVLKKLALALATVFGVQSLLGGLVLEVVAIAITILICFVSGLLGRRASAKNTRARLDQFLVDSFPGYTFVKNFTDNLRQSEELASSFAPVIVHFSDYDQLAFETQREPEGKVAIYLPGAPNPWSGSVIHVPSEMVERLAISLTDALRIIRTLGKDSIHVAPLTKPEVE